MKSKKVNTLHKLPKTFTGYTFGIPPSNPVRVFREIHEISVHDFKLITEHLQVPTVLN